MIQLELPSVGRAPAFEEYVDEMIARGEKIWESYCCREGESWEQYAERQLRQATQPDPGLVPETIYWAVLDSKVVGRISLRHRLEGNLYKFGGHIGYEVRPTYRRKGIATEMLRLILLTPKAIEVGKVLLTCAPENVPSNKTIVANGGVLTQTIFVDFINAHRNHYWIDLGKS